MTDTMKPTWQAKWIDQNYQIDRYGVALMMIREGYADPAGLARRILSEFDARQTKLPTLLEAANRADEGHAVASGLGLDEVAVLLRSMAQCSSAVMIEAAGEIERLRTSNDQRGNDLVTVIAQRDVAEQALRGAAQEARVECPNCHNANKYGDYEGPTCEVCMGGFVKPQAARCDCKSPDECSHEGRCVEKYLRSRESEKSDRAAALAQARCTTCEARGYIVKDHTVNGPYIVDCPTCSVTSTDHRCGLCDGPLPCLTHSQESPYFCP